MREKKDYAFLQPVQIGNRTFKNRIIYPAMCKLVLTFSACFPSAVNMVAVASLENRN